MTAPVALLGEIHQDMARVCKELLSPREEPMVNRDGEPIRDKEDNIIMRRVMPTAAEIAQVNAFLRNNNITASGEDGDALDELRKLVERRNSKRVPAAPVLPDPYDVAPGYGGLN